MADIPVSRLTKSEQEFDRLCAEAGFKAPTTLSIRTSIDLMIAGAVGRLGVAKVGNAEIKSEHRQFATGTEIITCAVLNFVARGEVAHIEKLELAWPVVFLPNENPPRDATLGELIHMERKAAGLAHDAEGMMRARIALLAKSGIA